MRTALVATVRNEARRLPEFLESIERQTRRPDIVVIADGGSTDGTQDLLAEFASRTSLPFKWSPVPGNRSKGRNAAIRLSKGDAIAVTDVSVLRPDWLEKILAPLEAGTADVVAGWYELRVEGARERCIGLLTQYSLDQVDAATFLPSSRSVAFTRDAWERAGGYPEAFAGNEDTVFDLTLERLRLRKVFVRDAIVSWRPAGSAREVYRQYHKYAVGDGQAGIFLWSYTRYGFFYAAYAAGIALLLFGFLWPWLWVALALAAVAYVAFRIRKVPQAGLWGQIPYAIFIAFTLDLAWMAGYARGKLRRPGPWAVRDR